MLTMLRGTCSPRRCRAGSPRQAIQGNVGRKMVRGALECSWLILLQRGRGGEGKGEGERLGDEGGKMGGKIEWDKRREKNIGGVEGEDIRKGGEEKEGVVGRKGGRRGWEKGRMGERGGLLWVLFWLLL